MMDDEYDPEPGAAGPLVGVIYPLLIWVSTPSDPWSPAQKAALRGAASEARQWIRNEAAARGIEVEFLPGGEFGSDRDIQISEVPLACGSGEELTTWMPEILRGLGYRSPGQLYDQVQLATRCDGMHAILFVRGSGRSYAVCAPGDPDADNVIPAAACYLGRDGKVSKETIAHELLHLHGAWDLYEDPPNQGRKHQASLLHFPNDIMFRVTPNLGALEIGPLTAWRIGWEPKAASWYDFFRPETRASLEPRWCAADPPPPQRTSASGATTVRPRTPEPPLLPPPIPSAVIRQPQQRATERPPPLPKSTRQEPPIHRIEGTRPEDLSRLTEQEEAYSRLMSVAREIIRNYGVSPREHLALQPIDPPRIARPSRGLRWVQPASKALWSAHDEAKVDQESLRRAIKEMRGAGAALEQKLSSTFVSWKAAIKRATDLRDSGVRGLQLADAEESAQSLQRRVANQLDTLQKRTMNPANIAVVTSASRFVRSFRKYQDLCSHS